MAEIPLLRRISALRVRLPPRRRGHRDPPGEGPRVRFHVVLLDVNAASYPVDDESRHLLHIGATRAAHQLWLISTGRPSLLLPEFASLRSRRPEAWAAGLPAYSGSAFSRSRSGFSACSSAAPTNTAPRAVASSPRPPPAVAASSAPGPRVPLAAAERRTATWKPPEPRRHGRGTRGVRAERHPRRHPLALSGRRPRRPVRETRRGLRNRWCKRTHAEICARCVLLDLSNGGDGDVEVLGSFTASRSPSDASSWCPRGVRRTRPRSPTISLRCSVPTASRRASSRSSDRASGTSPRPPSAGSPGAASTTPRSSPSPQTDGHSGRPPSRARPSSAQAPPRPAARRL